ncbi:MAG: hypothetical protein AAGJ40_17540 [Planctomycetota bacterium]
MPPPAVVRFPPLVFVAEPTILLASRNWVESDAARGQDRAILTKAASAFASGTGD